MATTPSFSMSKQKVIITRRASVGGKVYDPSDDAIEVSDRDARILIAYGFAQKSTESFIDDEAKDHQAEEHNDGDKPVRRKRHKRKED